MKAQKHEIVDELQALGQHYIRSIRTPEQEERFLRDYLNDLGSYPLSAIKQGCIAWRNSDASKFPTPGQLVAKVRANLPREQREDRPEPWRHLTEEEYNRLSLRDKIRHRTILAGELRRKAGPMWANGQPVAAEAMPERWHELMSRSHGHYEEAGRLKATLARAEGAA